MGVPISHHTRSRRNKGRSHMALKAKNLPDCAKCGSPVLPHTVCGNCGYYGGREVVNVLAKMDKKEKKIKQKELAAQEKAHEYEHKHED